jgi:endonuclease G
MKKYLVSFVFVSALAAFLFFSLSSSAQEGQRTDSPAASTTFVLSQVSGGNGFYTNDWVEIKNISAASQSLNGLALYYGSATGNFGAGAFSLPNISILPGQYYLVQLGSGGGPNALPVTPDASTSNINMSGSSGKIGLVVASALPASTCGATATPCTGTQLNAFVDMVVYGAAGNGAAGNGEGGNPTVNNGVALTSTQGSVRKSGGCQDTDNNNNDFDVVTNPVPRNTGTAPTSCGGGGTTLQGSGAASPSTVLPGGTTLLTVTVIPATSPTPSININVHTDLSSIGGNASQSFFDDGTHGDVTAGDNVFSFSEVVPATASFGNFTLPVSIADQQSTVSASISLTINDASPHTAAEHEVLGNPSGAMPDPIGFANDYLMEKNQYVLSYSRDRGTPNWVEWHMDLSWTGAAPRQDDYREDTLLPSNWYHVQGSDYTGSPTGEGFDRGHMCPSADRQNTVADNSATFLMTNMVPQAPMNNQIVWGDLENYARTLVDAGNELYIFSGGAGVGGVGLQGLKNTIVNGHVTVPAYTWKVIVVLPVGANDAQRVNQFTRVISVIMPNNQQTIARPWTQYRVSVGNVETLTGLRFFNKIRPTVRARLKKRVDNQ